jgi:thiamine-phosphate pyrophosphorylase
MLEWCSPAVSRVIEAAVARNKGSAGTTVAVEWLLLELIAEEDGRAATLLARHGLQRTLVQKELTAETPSTGIVPIDAIVAEARAISRECDMEGTATSEYFLLAVFRNASALIPILAKLGLDLAGLEREVLGEGHPPLEMAEPIQFEEAPERMAAGRILDANANRARESLRILDDYCRFVLDDAFLTGQVKSLRHDFATLLDSLPANLFLTSRETLMDVGAGIGTISEMQRGSSRDVARVNLKRLQEAMRSLEEFGKIFAPAVAEGLEQFRYRAYTLEKAILIGDDSRKLLADACLCVLLSGAQCEASLDWTIAEAAAGGVTMFQLREKDLDDRSSLARAREVRRWTEKAGAMLIVNDRPDIARLAGADGVHLGQEDLSVHDARRILGPDALVGVSTHDLEQVRRAVVDGANYIGIGPTFSSLTKHFDKLSGLEFVAKAVAETSLPAFAIGGINLDNIAEVVKAGAKRVAVSAAISKTDDPRMAARLMIAALKR